MFYFLTLRVRKREFEALTREKHLTKPARQYWYKNLDRIVAIEFVIRMQIHYHIIISVMHLRFCKSDFTQAL